MGKGIDYGYGKTNRDKNKIQSGDRHELRQSLDQSQDQSLNYCQRLPSSLELRPERRYSFPVFLFFSLKLSIGNP